MLPYDRKLKERSQQLRKEMTTAEKLLWSRIRGKKLTGYWFYRQKPVGEYIADFYCPNAKPVIEVDGGHHFNTETCEYDKVRNAYLKGMELRVLRFTNTQVLSDIDTVLDLIKKEGSQPD